MNSRLSYVSSSGKEIPIRQMLPLEKCGKKCGVVDVRKSLFNAYWSLGSHDKRVDFLLSLINYKNKKCSRVRIENTNKFRGLT